MMWWNVILQNVNVIMCDDMIALVIQNCHEMWNSSFKSILKIRQKWFQYRHTWRKVFQKKRWCLISEVLHWGFLCTAVLSNLTLALVISGSPAEELREPDIPGASQPKRWASHPVVWHPHPEWSAGVLQSAAFCQQGHPRCVESCGQSFRVMSQCNLLSTSDCCILSTGAS